MTYEEAKHRIIRVLPDDFLKNEENREALSLMGIALGKQIPKKPKTLNYGLLIEYGWKYGCPNCGCAVGNNKNLAFAYSEYLNPYEDYCCSCGQALDWSDTE